MTFDGLAKRYDDTMASVRGRAAALDRAAETLAEAQAPDRSLDGHAAGADRAQRIRRLIDELLTDLDR